MDRRRSRLDAMVWQPGPEQGAAAGPKPFAGIAIVLQLSDNGPEKKQRLVSRIALNLLEHSNDPQTERSAIELG